MKFVCGLVESVCNNTRSLWDFRYLKINCNLSVKSKLSCRCLSAKLPKNNMHPMVEKSERFFLMRLLQWNVKSSHLSVSQKRYSENFGKIHKKTPVLESLLIWDYRDSNTGVNFANFKNTYFVEHLRTAASEMLHD